MVNKMILNDKFLNYYTTRTNTSTNTSINNSYCCDYSSICKLIYPVYDRSNSDTSFINNKIYNSLIKATSNWSTYNTISPPSPPQLTVSEQFRQILQSRQTPAFILSRTPVKIATELREKRARETLRRILGDEKFQKFIRNGFVSVQGKSGRIYQIYPGHGMTVVYNHGTPIEKLCVVLDGNFTPTDSLITRYIMILHDEDQFRSFANVWKAFAKSKQQQHIDIRPLPQILQSLKIAA